VSLGDLVGQRWPTSTVRRKLARVQWLPIEADPRVPLAERRIGAPRLWSPSAREEAVLRADWEEHMDLLATGRFDEVDARLGVYLQVRPKAANGRALALAGDVDGAPSATLPRGFYLRPRFTRELLGA
ncbi:MAG: MutH/Sau3AI family endonuclease, partial [Gammaproteobacteria bacterium]